MPRLEVEVQQLKAKVNRLLEDYRIGASLTGPFPEAPSAASLRHRGTEYYLGGCPAARPTFSTLAVTVDRIYAVPFYAPSRPNRVDGIALRVTTGGGTYVRLGIYDNGANLRPGRLVLDAGTVATDTTGLKATTVAKSLTRGLKWLVAVFNGTPTVLSLDGDEVGTWGILGAGISDLTSFYAGWSATFPYAALSNSFPTADLAKRLWEPVIALRFR